ncbi:MAG: hypothetical protein HY063_00945 [Bacteroidetes bacterium]|nr:hypothetical protein [Bacteroidota bacterium]
MRKFKKYYDLIQSLSSKEWQLLESNLTCYGSNHRSEEKILPLARLLREAPDSPPPARIAAEIYGSDNSSNLNALKQINLRLKNRALDILISDLACNNEESDADDADTALMNLKRKCTQFQLLFHSKPGMELCNDLLEEIISEAKELEDYPTLIHHLNLKRWILDAREGGRASEKLKAEVKRFQKCWNAQVQACDYVHELKAVNEFSGRLKKKKVNAFFKKAIPHLMRLHSQTSSPYVLYYLRTLEVAKCLHEKNYSQARSRALELLKVIRENKSVRKKQRVGIAHSQMAMCEIYMGQYEHALQHSCFSFKCFPEKHYNKAISKQYEFYSLCLLKRYEEAELCAREMLSGMGKEQAGGFRMEKFHYLLACALFMQEKYPEAISALEYKKEIKRDKEGWEFNRRVLYIMACIENKIEDKASAEVLSLYQFMRDNKEAAFSSRQESIMKLLSLIEKSGFDYSQLNGKAFSCIEQLQSSYNDYGWDILSPELIPFHEWAMSKVRVKAPVREMGMAF